MNMPPMNNMGMMEGVAPSISGKWLNKKTGNTIVVRDSFIVDDKMQLMLQDGSMMDMDEFSKYYIQVGDEVEGSKTLGQSPAYDVPQDDLAGIYGDKPDPSILDKPFNSNMTVSNKKSKKTQSFVEVPVVETAVEYQSNPMIEKIFNKINSAPTIHLDFDWKNFPSKELKMLIEFFDVKETDIAEFIYNKYFDKQEIVNTINKKLGDLI